jgi:hypothetical protein
VAILEENMTNIHILKRHIKNLGKAIKNKGKRKSREDRSLEKMEYDQNLIKEKIRILREKKGIKR